MHTGQRVPLYVQVLRNFWRVFAWHVTTFSGIFVLYSMLADGVYTRGSLDRVTFCDSTHPSPSASDTRSVYCISILLLFSEPASIVRYHWSVMTFTSICSYGMLPLFDLLLINVRSLQRRRFWRFLWQQLLLHSIRLTFVLTALITVGCDGIDSQHLQWDGKRRNESFQFSVLPKSGMHASEAKQQLIFLSELCETPVFLPYMYLDKC